MKKNSKFLPILLILSCTFSSILVKNPASKNPYILFLLTDDLACSAVGFLGNKEAITPDMDQLAKEGVVFTNHYNSTAICMATCADIIKL